MCVFLSLIRSHVIFIFGLSSIRVGGVHSFAMSKNEIERPSIKSLLHRAQTLRQQIFSDGIALSFLSDPTQLAYPSSKYTMISDSKVSHRGFCNWLLPNVIMIGQYPGMTPETNGPSQKECFIHIKNMVCDANISLFCCLQSEVPCQSDDDAWTEEIYLEPYYRREFPRPFTRYGEIAKEFSNEPIEFIHNPIEDLSVPTCNDSLLDLLSRLIHHLEANDHNNAIYIHCWGGRGRAGLVGSCLLSLLFPELKSDNVLSFVQNAYNTRLGAGDMPLGLRRSPQTEQQRLFVREFVSLVHNAKIQEH